MTRLPAPPLPEWIARQLPLGLVRYCVPVGNQQIHVMEVGDGFPVLMLHGNPTWGFLYRKVVTKLYKKPFRLIFPDLVGLGFSSKPSKLSDHTLENHGRWLSEFLDQMGFTKIVLVCQDWGGPIGLRALANRPEILVGLVVLNTVLGPPKPDFRPTTFHRFARTPILSDIAFRLFSFPQTILYKVQGDPSTIRGDVARAYTYPIKGLRKNAAPLALARMVPDTMEHPAIESLQKCQGLVQNFRGPAAIVWGDNDPVLGRLLRRTQELLPNATTVHTQAGHFLQEEVPDTIADAICGVVNQLEKM